MKSISLGLFPDGSISWMRDCAGVVQGIMQTKVSWRLDHSYLQVNKYLAYYPILLLISKGMVKENYER